MPRNPGLPRHIKKGAVFEVRTGTVEHRGTFRGSKRIGQEIPKNAMLFLYTPKLMGGTMPIYVYKEEIALGRGRKTSCHVVDLHMTPLSSRSPEEIETIHEIVRNLGLEKVAEKGKVIVKTHAGILIESELPNEMKARAEARKARQKEEEERRRDAVRREKAVWKERMGRG